MTKMRMFATGLIGFLILPLGPRSLSAGQQHQDQTVRDEDISVTSFQEMDYPPLARLAHRQGVVVVRVNLDESGKVVSALAISGHELLIKEVLLNARKWQFSPNHSKAAVIVYEFRIAEGTCGDAGKQLFVFHDPNIASIEACAVVEHWQQDSNLHTPTSK